MTRLVSQLDIDRCPHCHVDRPSLMRTSNFKTNSYDGSNEKHWKTYACIRCGGVVLAGAETGSGPIIEMYPDATSISEDIPKRARVYLNQAISSQHAPAASIMVTASAVDAMLKKKGYREKDESLYRRIDRAKDDHLITEEMATWAHEVRLDANVQRHADEGEPLPTSEDAQKAIEFALALAEFLFVLPKRVERGLGKAKQGE